MVPSLVPLHSRRAARIRRSYRRARRRLWPIGAARDRNDMTAFTVFVDANKSGWSA